MGLVLAVRARRLGSASLRKMRGKAERGARMRNGDGWTDGLERESRTTYEMTVQDWKEAAGVVEAARGVGVDDKCRRGPDYTGMARIES
jgi:hypothetical protein